MQEHDLDIWNKFLYSNSMFESKQHLRHFEVVCIDISLFVEHVHQSWLTSYKENFFTAWTNQVTHLGNTTTYKYMLVSFILLRISLLLFYKIESAHWRVKNMLNTSRGDLCKC